MADERENSGIDNNAGGRDALQSAGRQENAAQPLDAGRDHGGPERYPSVRQDDAVESTGRGEQVTGQTGGETRSFDPSADAPTPEAPVTAEGDFPVSANEGRIGPGADPVEGKR